jgi:hypothetical protein
MTHLTFRTLKTTTFEQASFTEQGFVLLYDPEVNIFPAMISTIIQRDE